MKISISRRNIVIAGCLASIAAWTLPSQAAPVSFKVALTGAQQVPPVQTGANGTADLSYDPATRMLTWSVTYNGLSGPATMAHFHGPAVEGKNGPAGDLASRKGGYGYQSDQGASDTHSRTGPAIDGGRVVRQRSYTGQSKRRNSWSGYAA